MEFEGVEDGDEELEVEEEEEEEGDSGFEDGVTGEAREVEPLLQSDGATKVEEKNKEEHIPAPKHDIKINLEQEQEPAVADTIQSVKETAGVAQKKVSTATHRNGASFMAACLVAAAAIVLVWGRK